MAVKKDTPPALPAPKTEAPKTLALVDQVEKDLKAITKENFYSITRNGIARMEPDARALQHYANSAGGFCTKIVDSGMDEKKAWAVVQMWPMSKPEMVKEDKVTIVYSIEFKNLLWDLVDKGCARHKNGCPLLKDGLQLVFQDNAPVLSDPTCQLGLMRQLNRKMKFAERECVTKAEARMHKKFLNFEWRDDEEIVNEAAEVAAVSASSPTLPASTTAQAATPVVVNQAPKEKPKTEDPPEPVGSFMPPKAIIPTEEEMRKRAEGQPAKSATEAPKPAETPKVNGGTAPAGQPKKKRSERMNEYCDQVGCSGTNLLAFIATALGISEPSEIKSKGKPEDIDAVLFSLEYCAKEFGPKAMGPFIKKEMPEGVEHSKLAKAFLTAFAQEIKKSGGN